MCELDVSVYLSVNISEIIQPGFRLLTPQAALSVKSRNLLNALKYGMSKLAVDLHYVTYCDFQGDCRSKVMLPKERIYTCICEFLSMNNCN